MTQGNDDAKYLYYGHPRPPRTRALGVLVAFIDEPSEPGRRIVIGTSTRWYGCDCSGWSEMIERPWGSIAKPEVIEIAATTDQPSALSQEELARIGQAVISRLFS